MALRVLHLNSLLTGGGTDDQCVRLSEGLRRLGVDAGIAGPDGRRFSGIVREAGVPFHVTPKEGPLKLGFILSAAKHIRRQKHDVVHGHHGRDLWPTVLAARLSGRRPRIVITRHLAKSPGSAFSRRFLLGRIDSMVCVSEFVASVLKRGHRDPASPETERHWRPPMRGDFSKLTVIHGGIDTKRFSPREQDSAVEALRTSWGLKPGDFAFAVIGGFIGPRGKGQREFLKAAAKIHGSRPSAKFLIIGQGDMAERLQADIRELGLEGAAWLTGHCSDMPLAMNAIDCLVHPQIGTESLGLVVCEAHACGRPVIASDLDGIPEAFHAAAYGALVQAEDVGALASAMNLWAGTKPLSNGERQRLHGLVDGAFSLEKMSVRTEGLYRKLVRNRP